MAVLITSVSLILGWFYFYPNSDYNKLVRENEVLDDFWIEYNLIDNKILIKELQDIAKNSQYPRNKFSATDALMTIYGDGMRGESKNYQKALYWCNEAAFINSDFNESVCESIYKSK